MSSTKAKLLAIMLSLAVAALACESSTVEVNPSDGQQLEGGQPAVGSTAIIGQPAVESTETTAPLGSARSNPAPAGSEVIVDDMAFVITGSTRPATDVIMAGNQFNTQPEAGQEYVMVNVKVTCMKPADDKCNFSSYNLKLLGSSGIQRDPQLFVAGVSGLLDLSASEFFGGASLEGGIPFIVNSDETDLLLVYSPLLGDEFYLSIQ